MTEENKKSDPGAKIQEKMHQLWHGQIPLFQAFWIYYVAIVIGLQIIGSAVGIFSAFFGVMALGWAGFMVLPIWTAADKYQGQKMYALAAKIAAVLIGFGVLASLLNGTVMR